MPEVWMAPEVLSWEALEDESMTPHPVPVILCGVCGMPWELHQELAERRLGIPVEEDEDGYLAFTDDQVSLQECVQLLLMSHPGVSSS